MRGRGEAAEGERAGGGEAAATPGLADASCPAVRLATAGYPAGLAAVAEAGFGLGMTAAGCPARVKGLAFGTVCQGSG